MQLTLAVAFLFCAMVMGAPSGVVLPATTLIRTPQHDSAIIQSDRVGGNFAYSTVEGHAYAAVQPVVQEVVKPVAVTYQVQPVHQPIISLVQQPIIHQIAHPQLIHQQIISPIGLVEHPLLVAGGPVVGAPAPQQDAAPQEQSPAAPPQGASVDEDSVSVESA